MRRSTSHEDALSTPDRPSIGRPSGALYVSIVCSTDGARFATVAASEEACLAQIASYIAEQTARELWPPSVQRVHQLLAAGDTSAAVAEYFRHTGERWDREWLVTTSLDPNLGSTAWSGTIPLPEPSQPDGTRPHEPLELLGGAGQANRSARRAHELES